MDSVQKTVLDRDGVQALIDLLKARGWRVVGPVMRDGAILYDEIDGVADLPAGWTDHQDGGEYRLERRDDGALFSYAVGPHSWKRYLHPPTRRLWRAERCDDGFRVLPEAAPAPRFAFIGVRSCELHAIAIQDRVLAEGDFADPDYRSRRAGAFIVAVHCGHAAGTCFCVSTGTGPRADSGFDIALVEVLSDGDHRFVAEAGSNAGADMLDQLPHREAQANDIAGADAVVALTAESMGREMPVAGLRDLLLQNLDHPRWDEVAERCLACANCTMVCPTCFCSTVEDETDLDGAAAARTRRWDSCFTMDFSYLHGGSVRSSTRARYRQWMTHKLATWIDQFGVSGCVGCGRCITWCPVGIDITEEVRAIGETAPSGAAEEGDGSKGGDGDEDGRA